MAKVGTAIAITDQSSAGPRPTRSPIWPKRIAPIGRMRKPTAKTPKAAKSEVLGSCVGK
jgi:hypothetical protein